MSELHFYDFDGTLFRSPHEPAVWEGDWWNDVRSLTPPCVPDHPSGEWWVQGTVSDAKESIRDPDVYAILATGRPANSGLRWRVPELLKMKGLNFDEVHLAPPSGTLAWKKRILFSALQRFSFGGVRIWDDRISHLPEFKSVALKMGVPPENIHLTHVRARSMEPECDESNFEVGTPHLKPQFYGIFLDSKSRALLAHTFPPAHQKLKAEHITLAFKPKMTSELAESLGKPVSVEVIGYAADENAQAVVVQLPEGFKRQDGRPAHVTLSVAEGYPSEYSNTLIAQGPILPVPRLTLTGLVDVEPRSLRPSPGCGWVSSFSVGRLLSIGG